MPPTVIAASIGIQTLVYAALLWRLLHLGLARVYVSFTALVLFEPLRGLVSFGIPRDSTMYGWFYFLTQPIQWLLYAFVTLEVYNSVFRSLTGISRLTRYVIVAATGLSVVVSTLSLTLQTQTDSPFRTLELYFSLERAIFLSLLTFVLMLVGFLSWYPVPVHKNAVVYSAVFAFYFGIKTTALLVRTIGGPEFAVPVSVANIVASVVSGCLWIGLLTAAGETRRAKPVHRMSPEEEEKLIAQLESINRTLLRSVPERPKYKS